MRAPTTDAQPPIPLRPSGTFGIASTFDLTATPAAAMPILDELAAATDDPDDPSRYIVDRLVAALPDGQFQTYAQGLAPLLAAYLDVRLADVAPRCAPGLRALATGLTSIARRFGTHEVLQIGNDGVLTRTITGLHFETGGEKADVAFADHGLADLTTMSRASLKADHLAIAEHALALPYGRLLRLGLDHFVVPAVDATASDLGDALRDLVNCQRIGELVAAALGIGSAAMYADACAIAMTAAAHELYDRIAAIDGGALVTLELAGTAHVTDPDGDGEIEALDEGTWTLAGGAGTGTFAGTRQEP